MEIKSLKKLAHLYQFNPEFRAAMQNNLAKALVRWQITDEQSAQTVTNDNKWLSYSPEALCTLMAQGEPLNWDGPIPLPPLPNVTP